MTRSRFLTIAEQVAEHLRGELLRGRWNETLPGLPRLSKELGVNHKTIDVALRLLERDGLLIGQGAGRKRRIVQPDSKTARPMRIGFLTYEPVDLLTEYIIKLQHDLEAAGHEFIAVTELRRALTEGGDTKALTDPKSRLARIERLVKQTAADVWVICAGTRETLEWFSAQPKPAFALFGRRRGLPIAGTGPDKPRALTAATRHLIGLGHQRIVLLCRKMRRLPVPGASERAFLSELAAHGIPHGEYNLPDWEATVEGFHERLKSLFQVRPPTTLIIDEAPFFVAAQQFLARRGMQVPEQVSLICTDPDSSFAWCSPAISHIHWDPAPVVRCVVRWAAAVSLGKKVLRQTHTPAEFVLGGTIGPVAS